MFHCFSLRISDYGLQVIIIIFRIMVKMKKEIKPKIQQDSKLMQLFWFLENLEFLSQVAVPKIIGSVLGFRSMKLFYPHTTKSKEGRVQSRVGGRAQISSASQASASGRVDWPSMTFRLGQSRPVHQTLGRAQTVRPGLDSSAGPRQLGRDQTVRLGLDSSARPSGLLQQPGLDGPKIGLAWPSSLLELGHQPQYSQYNCDYSIIATVKCPDKYRACVCKKCKVMFTLKFCAKVIF